VLKHDVVTSENCDAWSYDPGIAARHAGLGNAGGVGLAGAASQHQYAHIAAHNSFHLSAASTDVYTAEPLSIAIFPGG